MSRSQWIGVLSGSVLIISCFLPWVFLHDVNIVISGTDTTGTRYGEPAYNHFILVFFILAFTFIHKIWAKRWNLAVAALNLAWAIRNFILLSRCEAGECPEIRIGLYLVLITSIILLTTTFFPNIKLPNDVVEK